MVGVNSDTLWRAIMIMFLIAITALTLNELGRCRGSTKPM